MKKFFGWVLRIVCLVAVGAAAFTLIKSLIHVNDDHSYEAVMGASAAQTVTENAVIPTATALPVDSSVEEEPTVRLSADGSATTNHPTVTITASFGNIVSSVLADLTWYVDGEAVKENKDCLLVEGSTVTFDATMDMAATELDEAEVEMVMTFNDQTVTAQTSFPVEHPDGESSVVIQTEEITVTALRDSDVYADSGLTSTNGEMAADETGLLLAYEIDSEEDLHSLKLKFADNSEGWVDAEDMSITQEDCTTDEDYTEAQKVAFVNTMNYDSPTEYLVWVSLYTQKVNVFYGYKGNWTLVECFDCATGKNDTPTTTGIFTYSQQTDRWDLGSVYVAPVLIFNGGEAFTSRPYDEDTDEITDETMGEPASGGSVRMLEEDLAWMEEELPIGSMVVVF